MVLPFQVNSRILLFITVSLSFLSACSTPTPIIVEGVSDSKYDKPNRYKRGTNNDNRTFYRIGKGDTLYSIAWAHGLDYKTLARYNGIKKPYTIYVGKKLRLKPKYSWVHKPKKTISKTTISKKAISKKAISKKTSKTKVNNTYKKKVVKKKKPETPKRPKHVYAGKINFKWPIKGKIIQHFNLRKDKKGIDIAIASKGLKIRAAESGKVVYSGHGLTGYGLLLIIKHNNRYLSAYAHNSQLLVSEGMDIKQNQVIALSGKTATDRVKLHFEIRLDGNPVNPLKYLPKT